MGTKILYIGTTNIGDTSFERMKALEDLGHHVDSINSGKIPTFWKRAIQKASRTVGLKLRFKKLNRAIRNQIKKHEYDLVWVDKGTAIRSDTLEFIKKQQPECRLVHFNPDDPFGQFNKGWELFLEALPLYDFHFVSRAPNVGEYVSRGGKNVFPYDRSFSKLLHRPIHLSPSEREKYGVEVGFIGSHAPARAEMIAFLIKNGIPVAVHGNGWQGKSQWETIKPYFRGPGRVADEYVKTINGMNIALHFLRRENRDEQDSRTFEIPACGAFMLAERSPKHEEFFVENQEAVFFDTVEELLEKVRFYLQRPLDRQRIALAGRNRCVDSGYDHHSRMTSFLQIIASTP